jgi:hypothetical protein
MKPGNLDLPTIWRGCTYDTITLVWLDATGAPFDLTGWTPMAMSININLNARVIDAPNGVTTMSLPFQTTSGLRLGIEKWDWIWQHSGTITPPILSGTVEIKDPQTFIAQTT